MGILQDNMINSMKVNGYSSKTIKLYTSCIRCLSYFYKKPPTQLTVEEIESYFLHLRNINRSESTIHIYFESVKYFYRLHNQESKIPKIRISNNSKKVPFIITQKQVNQLLESCKSLKYKTIFTLIYSAGLRVSEAANLELADINFERKTIFIRNAKNQKDRYTILANKTIEILQKYLRVYHPQKYVFYGKDIFNPISICCIQKQFKKLSVTCNINDSLHVHTLRHCFATHLLENGTNIFYIMNLLGHSNIKTTMIYMHMQSIEKLNIVSPLDYFNESVTGRSYSSQTMLFEETA